MNARNPILEAENYWEGYQKNIEALKNDPKIIAFDKLCYELFEGSKTGKAFIELVKERYLLPSLVSKGNPTYQVDVLWQEGFKDAWRSVISALISHKQRIEAGNKE